LSFDSYRHHRDLHSFPTRRSSDLLDAVDRAAGEGHDVDMAAGVLAEVDDLVAMRQPGGAVVGRPRQAQLQRPDVAREGVRVHVADRKSTRLNSSHSQISYAVFCLK